MYPLLHRAPHPRPRGGFTGTALTRGECTHAAAASIHPPHASLPRAHRRRRGRGGVRVQRGHIPTSLPRPQQAFMCMHVGGLGRGLCAHRGSHAPAPGPGPGSYIFTSPTPRPRLQHAFAGHFQFVSPSPLPNPQSEVFLAHSYIPYIHTAVDHTRLFVQYGLHNSYESNQSLLRCNESTKIVISCLIPKVPFGRGL